ncbi:DUF4247 domain-containing protein [Nocardia neocaledoniensis]|uniref:Uncharacterized protein DUF4247 n=1 Tax=Nocardia neocaledoniensis TaxID=236511 RepID=A0A317N502_9NOCA|nr:DUF4247 domain-containing protein [Nocardia neocaledoniensis]PWV70371.1 uncharacterized protein DUF4247 [Nocardia neocaledoniensis]GEM34953.1 hypothetical protein NN3_59600 [Nocardia neocaledoniensis NBRC 108232]
MNRKKWIIAGAVTVVLTLIAVIVVVAVTRDQDPRAFVSEKYQRARQLDQANDGIAFTAAAAPAAVAAAIAKATDPRDRRNTGDNHYLRFDKDLVAVSPHAGGSLVLVDSWANGTRRHHSHTSAYGWNSGSAAGDYRGGGSDSGGK